MRYESSRTLRQVCGSVALVALWTGCVGCATVVRGTKEKLLVESQPPAAHVTLSNGWTGTTPVEFKLDRGKAVTVTIELAGYETAEVEVKPQVSARGAAGVAGNMMFGLVGLAGAAVDASSGASCNFVPNPVHVELEPIEEEQAHVDIKPNLTEGRYRSTLPEFSEGSIRIKILPGASEEDVMPLVSAPGSQAQVPSFRNIRLDPNESFVQCGSQRWAVEHSGDSFAVGGPMTFRMVGIDPLSYAQSQGATAPLSGSVIWVEPGDDPQTVVVTTDPAFVESSARAALVLGGQALPPLKLEFYLSPVEKGFAHQFLFGEGTQYWGATKGPVRLNGQVYTNLKGVRVVHGQLIRKTVDTAPKEAPAVCLVQDIERGPDSGDLWIGETDGRVSSVGCSAAKIGGALTHYGGTQTVAFRGEGSQEFRCPGTFYFAVRGALGTGKSPREGVDWAFVTDKGTEIPTWVERFGKHTVLADPNNTFLIPGQSFTGSVRQTTDKEGHLVEVRPPLGQEFGPDKRLLLVGRMEKSAAGWRICVPPLMAGSDQPRNSSAVIDLVNPGQE